MTMVINTNSAARERYNVLYRNKRSLDDTIGELSSGLLIKEAADDSAGLSISEKMPVTLLLVHSSATVFASEKLYSISSVQGYFRS